jgi:hypothetical protein
LPMKEYSFSTPSIISGTCNKMQISAGNTEVYFQCSRKYFEVSLLYVFSETFEVRTMAITSKETVYEVLRSFNPWRQTGAVSEDFAKTYPLANRSCGFLPSYSSTFWAIVKEMEPRKFRS